jgi:carboxypeptidase Q
MRQRTRSVLPAILSAIAVLLLANHTFSAKDKKPKPAPAVEAAAPAVAAPAIPDLEFITRLRDEEFAHGQVMDIMSHLTDDIGPRLTGSPNMKKANEWTRDELTKWGLADAHLEPWGTFGRGWAYQLCEVRMVSPDYMQMLALPEAWTPGTNGPVTGDVVHVVATKMEDLDKYKGQLAGKIVLMGEARVPEPIEKPMFTRYDDAELAKLALFQIPGARGPVHGAPALSRRAQQVSRR